MVESDPTVQTPPGAAANDLPEAEAAEKESSKNRAVPAWVTILAFLLLAGFLTMLALGLRNSQQGPIQIGQAVPPIVLTSFDGQTYQTQDYPGKVIVLNFWASWCKPCESEAAELEQAWQNYKPGGDVIFLGADYVDTEPEARGYLSKFGITYPNGPDLGTRISQTFRIKGVPETYIIGKNGTLAHAQIGPFNSVAEIISIIDTIRNQ
jgi:cytochrome c biogenesis protein CcmG/thiol:disulfide interchange protein DsbE